MNPKDKNHYIWFDWAVKHMLRNKANFSILEGFISVMIGKKMQVIEILESEGNQSASTTKFNRVDIKAKNDKGEIVIIEVQNIREMDFLERILFGVANAVTEQVDLGDRYSKIHKVYSISIVYFDFGVGEDYVYHGQTKLRGINKHDELIINTKEKEAIESKSADEVFPEYFIVRVEKFNPQKTSPSDLEQWMNYLKTGTISQECTAPGLAKARENLLFDKMTPREQKEYRQHIDEVRNQQDAIDDSRAEGVAQGILMTAKNMLLMGLDVEIISKATGLNPKEIEYLK